MKTATGLTLIALGAILAFAVNGHPSFLNIQVVGWVVMLTGLVGLLFPQRGYGWLQRRIVRQQRGPAGPVTEVDERRYSPYIMLNPGSLVANKEENDQELAGDPATETIDEYLEG